MVETISLSNIKKEPILFGILNVTPDSFSDGNLFLQTDKAIQQAHFLLQGGAHVIDIGAASSHPDAKKISAEEEIHRLKAVWEKLQHNRGRLYKLSLDSHNTTVQRYAIEKGVDYLNDTSGFSDHTFYPELAEASCRLIVMHSIQKSGMATRESTQKKEKLYTNIIHFFEKRIGKLIQKNIEKERLVLDPGMGFFLGNHPNSSLYILNKLQELKKYFSLPIMVSVSRKSFIGEIIQKDVSYRNHGTLAAELFAYQNGADYIRTHDVSALWDAYQVWNSLQTIKEKKRID